MSKVAWHLYQTWCMEQRNEETILTHTEKLGKVGCMYSEGVASTTLSNNKASGVFYVQQMGHRVS